VSVMMVDSNGSRWEILHVPIPDFETMVSFMPNTVEAKILIGHDESILTLGSPYGEPLI